MARVRRVYGVRSVGHTGTLDPFATGLLVILLGRATRLARFVSSQAKTYVATARLGVRTTTDDRTGDPLGETIDTAGLDEELVGAALAAFTGAGRQRPPVYSAKSVGGERSHRKARRGEAVALAETDVTVHEMTLVTFDPPAVTFRTTVSAGTYIRALARDLGERLGVGAHLTALRREAIGALRVERAVSVEDLTGETPLLPPRAVLGHLPAVELDRAARAKVVHGQPVAAPAPAPAPPAPLEGPVLLMEGDLVVAVATAEQGWLKPKVVLDAP